MLKRLKEWLVKQLWSPVAESLRSEQAILEGKFHLLARIATGQAPFVEYLNGPSGSDAPFWTPEARAAAHMQQAYHGRGNSIQNLEHRLGVEREQHHALQEQVLLGEKYASDGTAAVASIQQLRNALLKIAKTIGPEIDVWDLEGTTLEEAVLGRVEKYHEMMLKLQAMASEKSKDALRLKEEVEHLGRQLADAVQVDEVKIMEARRESKDYHDFLAWQRMRDVEARRKQVSQQTEAENLVRQ